jgi:hypothetical protein
MALGRPTTFAPLALWRDPARGFPLRAAFATLAAALFIGGPLIFGGRVLAGFDIVNSYYPQKQLLRSILSQGLFPHWNPLIFGGRPLQGDIQTGLFYPLNLPFWILPLTWAFTVTTLLHFWLAGWGMALWSRRWLHSEAAAYLAAVLFMLAGRFTVITGAWGIVLLPQTAAWLPWLLWAWHRLAQSLDEELDRAPWDFAAVVLLLAVAALAGSPQIAFYNGLALGVYALVLAWGAAPGMADENAGRSAAGEATERPLLPLRLRPVLLLGAAAGLAAGLCAVQLLPTQLLIGQSWDRARGASWDYVTDGSLEPRMLLTAVSPRFFGHPRDEFLYWGESGYHEVSNYVTAAGPFLALLLLALGVQAFVRQRSRTGVARAFGVDVPARRHATFFVLLLLAAAVLAPGKHSPVFWLAYHLVPGFDRFRVPARLMLWATLAVAGLAGRALDVLLGERDERQGTGSGLGRRSPLGAVAGLTVGGLAVLAVLWIAAPQLGASLGIEQLRPRQGQTTADWMREIETQQATARGEVLEFALQWALVGALAAGIVLAPASARRRRGVLAACLVVGCGVRLAMHGWLFTTAAPSSAFEPRSFSPAESAELAKLPATVQPPFYPRTERVALLERELSQGGRFLWLDSLLDWRFDQNQPELLMDRPIVHGLAQMRGYDPVNSRRFGLFMNAVSDLPPDTNPRGFMFVPDMDLSRIRWSLLQAWDCRVVLTYTASGEGADLEEIARWTFRSDVDGSPQVLRALRFREPWGPARLCRPIVARAGMALEALSVWMGQPDFDVRAMAIVEGGDPLAVLAAEPWLSQPPPSGDGAPAGPVRVVRSEAGRWEFDVQAPQPALLVVADGYYPGWQARVDGVAVPVVAANLAQCGVPVPAGRHRVEMFFRPREFVQGALVSGLSLMLMVLVVVRWRRSLRMG